MRQWFDFYRHQKIRHKLSLLIALTMLVTGGFAMLVQQYAFSIYDGQLYDKSAQVLNLSSASIETELRRIQAISYNIIADTEMQEMLADLRGETSEYDRMLLHYALVERLVTHIGSEPNVLSIQLFDALGVKHEAGNVKPVSPAKAALMTELARQSSGDLRWLYPDEEDDALVAVRAIRSFSTNSLSLDELGLMAIRINMDQVVRKYANAGGNLIVVSGGDTIYPEEPAVDPASFANRMTGRTGYFTEQYGDETYFVSYVRSSDTGWQYVNLTPYNAIFEQVVFLKELVVIVFIVLFALAVLWGFRFARGLTRPVEDLIGRMKLAEKGNFAEANLLPAPDAAAVSMDEIGLLQRTFRLMIERIGTLITENYESRLLIKETEFKALQAQINPHFLYNTLESINWLAKMNRQPQIAQMVESLAFLLRNSMHMKEAIQPLSAELEVALSYVTIQKYRFGDRLDFRMEVPERLGDRLIPKLTLQPLLENAIQYALEPAIGTCRIVVTAEEADGRFALSVEDDGPGMPDDVLDRLRSGERKAKGSGIGLLNIDERIKLAFGDGWGVRIGASSGGGARVTVVLPGGKEA